MIIIITAILDMQCSRGRSGYSTYQPVHSAGLNITGPAAFNEQVQGTRANHSHHMFTTRGHVAFYFLKNGIGIVFVKRAYGTNKLLQNGR